MYFIMYYFLCLILFVFKVMYSLLKKVVNFTNYYGKNKFVKYIPN